MASENDENSIDDRDLDNDADFLQNKGFNKGYDSICSMFLHNSDHPGMVLVMLLSPDPITLLGVNR